LARAGVIEIRAKDDNRGSTYELTQAGRELWSVLLAYQDWGARWVELTPEHAHPGVVLWTWVTAYLRRDRLPHRRTVVRFDFPTVSSSRGNRGWLLVERGDAEICENHPGGEEDLVVDIREPLAFARWHLGEIEWGDALRSGAIKLSGRRDLARALPTWSQRVTRPASAPAVAENERTAKQLDHRQPARRGSLPR